MYYKIIDTPLGKITLTCNNKSLISLNFGEMKSDFINEPQHPIIKITEEQLNRYFAGKLKMFQVPLNPKGTIFQKTVWNTLLEIPFGKTMSYGEVAKKLGNPKSVRAVGQANNKNPIPIIIPCHRVIGKDGSLVGYGGGLEIKKYLLALEGNNSDFIAL